MKLIELSKLTKNKGKYFAQVDDADYEYLNKFKWHVCKFPKTNYAKGKVYDSQSNKPIQVYMHRLIIGLKHGDKRQCDHIDHNGLNCQRGNLRAVTSIENNQNRRKKENSSSKYLGVCKYIARTTYTRKDGSKVNKLSQVIKWTATIKVNYKIINLGHFKTEIEAAIARDKAAKKYHGEFASLNFK